MADTTAFELVSPERLLLSKDVEMVIVPGAEGNLGILARHAPMLSTLRPGIIEVFEKRTDVSERIFVAGGFVEVTPVRCTVLAEHAVPLEQLDDSLVEQEIRDLQEDLEDAKSAVERLTTEKALTVARAKRSALR